MPPGCGDAPSRQKSAKTVHLGTNLFAVGRTKIELAK